MRPYVVFSFWALGSLLCTYTTKQNVTYKSKITNDISLAQVINTKVYINILYIIYIYIYIYIYIIYIYIYIYICIYYILYIYVPSSILFLLFVIHFMCSY